MKCPHCNGHGSYEGLLIKETCKPCNGTGEIAIPDTLPDDTELNKAPERPLIPIVGEKIYYPTEDLEGQITAVDDEERRFEAEFAYGRGHGSFNDIVWNLTQERWEIRTSSAT